MEYIQSFYTDIGRKRKTNQDSLSIQKAETDSGDILFAVMCDGMGGYTDGELASRFCVDTMADWFRDCFPDILFSGLGPQALKSDLSHLLEDCNHQLYEYGMRYHTQLGSTLTACLFWGTQYYCVHVGDSRMYEISNEVLQATRDHSWLEYEVAAGRMTREEADHDKRKNILMECMGITDTVSVDFYSGEILPDAVYLLCSDGFWHSQKPGELLGSLDGSRIDSNLALQEILKAFVELAMERGEKDNISVVGVIPKLEKGADNEI